MAVYSKREMSTVAFPIRVCLKLIAPNSFICFYSMSSSSVPLYPVERFWMPGSSVGVVVSDSSLVLCQKHSMCASGKAFNQKL